MFSGGILGGISDTIEKMGRGLRQVELDVKAGTSSMKAEHYRKKCEDFDEDEKDDLELKAKLQGKWDFSNDCIKDDTAFRIEKFFDLLDSVVNSPVPLAQIEYIKRANSEFGSFIRDLYELKGNMSKEKIDGHVEYVTEVNGVEKSVWIKPEWECALKTSIRFIDMFVDEKDFTNRFKHLMDFAKENEMVDEVSGALSEFQTHLNELLEMDGDTIPAPDPVTNSPEGGGKSFGDVIKENLENMVSPMQPTQNNA